MSDSQENPPAEIAPGVPQPAIVSNPSALNEQVASVMSMVAFALTFSTTLAGLVGQHDVSAIASYIGSAPVVVGMTGIASTALVVWRAIIKKGREKQKENLLVATAPAHVAMTTAEVAAVKAAATPEAAQAIVQTIDSVAAQVQAMAAPGAPPPPPSRAPETTTGTVQAPPAPPEGSPPPPAPSK